jgi:hypothetical protein
MLSNDNIHEGVVQEFNDFIILSFSSRESALI